MLPQNSECVMMSADIEEEMIMQVQVIEVTVTLTIGADQATDTVVNQIESAVELIAGDDEFDIITTDVALSSYRETEMEVE